MIELSDQHDSQIAHELPLDSHQFDGPKGSKKGNIFEHIPQVSSRSNKKLKDAKRSKSGVRISKGKDPFSKKTSGLTVSPDSQKIDFLSKIGEVSNERQSAKFCEMDEDILNIERNEYSIKQRDSKHRPGKSISVLPS